MSHPAFSRQPQSIATLWPVFISRPAEVRRLSWPISSGNQCTDGSGEDVMCCAGTAMLEHLLQLCEHDGTFDNTYL